MLAWMRGGRDEEKWVFGNSDRLRITWTGEDQGEGWCRSLQEAGAAEQGPVLAPEHQRKAKKKEIQ